MSSKRLIAKVCGITHNDDLRMALDEGADFVGFLHYPPSPRHCANLCLMKEAGDKGVLVVVARDISDLLELVKLSSSPWVQPHLPVELQGEGITALKETGFNVILPWPDQDGNLMLQSDLYLWENTPSKTGLMGGSGKAHDMSHPPPGPFLLAGGMDANSVQASLEAMPDSAKGLLKGFDAASRLESSPGRKDPDRVKRFLNAVHER